MFRVQIVLGVILITLYTFTLGGSPKKSGSTSQNSKPNAIKYKDVPERLPGTSQSSNKLHFSKEKFKIKIITMGTIGEESGKEVKVETKYTNLVLDEKDDAAKPKVISVLIYMNSEAEIEDLKVSLKEDSLYKTVIKIYKRDENTTKVSEEKQSKIKTLYYSLKDFITRKPDENWVEIDCNGTYNYIVVKKKIFSDKYYIPAKCKIPERDTHDWSSVLVD